MGCALGIAMRSYGIQRVLERPFDSLCDPVHWVVQRADQWVRLAQVQITRLCNGLLSYLVIRMVHVNMPITR